MSVKSVYKGHDCARTEFSKVYNDDEINTFVDARYVSATEAAWRLFEFRMHQQSHTIIRLPVHLPGRQNIYFQAGEEERAAVKATEMDTQLTAWFKFNQSNPEANKHLYTDIPNHYIFDSSKREWRPHKKCSLRVISRMYSVNPSDSERFHLRMLLLHIAGAKSYEDLCTIDGHVAETFQVACNLMGLLEDDNEWDNALMEAASFQMPKALRRMFALILIHNSPIYPLQLWCNHRQYMIEDFLLNHNELDSAYMALSEISSYLEQHNKSLGDYMLPNPNLTSDNPDELYDIAIEADKARELRSLLNDEQLIVADTILFAVERSLNPVDDISQNVYLDKPGGSGKTFIYNYLVHELCGRNMRVAASA